MDSSSLSESTSRSLCNSCSACMCACRRGGRSGRLRLSGGQSAAGTSAASALARPRSTRTRSPAQALGPHQMTSQRSIPRWRRSAFGEPSLLDAATLPCTEHKAPADWRHAHQSAGLDWHAHMPVWTLCFSQKVEGSRCWLAEERLSSTHAAKSHLHWVTAMHQVTYSVWAECVWGRLPFKHDGLW